MRTPFSGAPGVDSLGGMRPFDDGDARPFADADPPELCPLQLLTLGFDGSRFKGEILPELERLKRSGIVRVVDLLVIRKDASGGVATVTASDLDWEEATEFGAKIGALVGWGVAGEEGASYGAMLGAAELADGHAFGDRDRMALLDLVPPGSSAALVLLEHVWAEPLRQAVERADGRELDNRWLRADDLILYGLSLAPRAGLDEGADEGPE
jgi:uncharacterized membrane protein